MGADYKAKAVIGIKIDKEKLLQPPKKVKAFEHNHPETMKFDPQSGKALWTTEQEPIADYDEDEDKLGPYTLYYGTDHDDCIVGVVGCDDTYSNCGNILDFAKLPTNIEVDKQRLRQYLEPLGLWNEADFGLYAMLYCSY